MDIIAYTLEVLNMVVAVDLVEADLEQEVDLMVAVDLETQDLAEVELVIGMAELLIQEDLVDLVL